MKKITATVLTLIFAAGLTACNDIGAEESYSDTSNPLKNSTSAIYTNVGQSESNSMSGNKSENDESSPTDPFEGMDIGQMRKELYGDDIGGRFIDITPETSWVVDDFRYRGVAPIAPDGSILDLSEALYAYGHDEGTVFLGFDFAYLRYAKPLYRTTFNDPELYNCDYSTFFSEYMKGADSSDFFKVRVGDTLENGLVVKAAEYWHCKTGGWDRMEVELSGEITLNGVLVLNRESPWVEDKSMYFIPNPCDTRIPTINNMVGSYNNSDDDSDKFAAVFDGNSIGVNYKSNFSDDLLNIFKDSRHVEVSIVLKDIKFDFWSSMASNYRNSAELVSVEVI